MLTFNQNNSFVCEYLKSCHFHHLYRMGQQEWKYIKFLGVQIHNY